MVTQERGGQVQPRRGFGETKRGFVKPRGETQRGLVKPRGGLVKAKGRIFGKTQKGCWQHTKGVWSNPKDRWEQNRGGGKTKRGCMTCTKSGPVKKLSETAIAQTRQLFLSRPQCIKNVPLNLFLRPLDNNARAVVQNPFPELTR